MPEPDGEIEPLREEIDQEFADKLRDAQNAYDECKAYLDDLKDELKKQYIGIPKVVGTVGGNEVFTYTTYSSTRINSARLKREYPDIFAQFAKELTHQRVAVRRWRQ